MSTLLAGWAVVGVLATACGKTRHPHAEPTGGDGSAGEYDSSRAGEGGAAGSAGEPHGGAPTLAGAAGAGGAGDAGASTGGPAPHDAVDCDGKSISLNEERVRRCVLLTSCTGGRRSPASTSALRLGACITNGFTFSDVQIGGEPGFPRTPWSTPWSNDARLDACRGRLDSCDDVLACAGFRAPVDECVGDRGARCEGDLAVNCGDEPLVVDCARTTGKAGACQVLGSGASARAACVVKASCDPATPVTACDGDVAYSCDSSGKGVGANCAAFGQKCFRGEGGLALCAPAPPPATSCSGSEFECQDDKLTFCTETGKRYDIDCAAGGEFTCFLGFQEPPDSLLYGCHPRSCHEASTRIYDDACDGDDVVLGLGDTDFEGPSSPPTATARVHCPDYGFATCHEGRCVD